MSQNQLFVLVYNAGKGPVAKRVTEKEWGRLSPTLIQYAFPTFWGTVRAKFQKPLTFIQVEESVGEMLGVDMEVPC